MAKIILIASGKGGTGKTSTCSHLSVALASEGKKVLAIDTDSGFKGLDITLGLSEKVVFNFSDILSKTTTIDKAVVSFNENLDLLSAPLTPLSTEYTISHIAKLIDSVYNVYDYILIDCSAGYSYETELFAKISQTAIVVATPDMTSLRGAENIARELEQLGLSNAFLILNRVRPRLILKSLASNIDDAIDATHLPLLGIIPEDEKVISCGNQGKSIFDFKRSQSATAYKNISSRLLGRQVSIMKLR